MTGGLDITDVTNIQALVSHVEYKVDGSGWVSSTGVVVLLVLSRIPGMLMVVLKTQVYLWWVHDKAKG